MRKRIVQLLRKTKPPKAPPRSVEFWERVYERPTALAAHNRDIRSVADIDETYGGEDRFKLLAMLDPSADETVLDCGCGEGDWTILLARFGATVVAVDRSINALTLLRQRLQRLGLQALLVCCDLASLPFDCARFDKIFGSLILHHLDNFRRVGEELGRVMRRGGKAIFWENSADNGLLILARNHLSGRYGIPKFGDYTEHPLRASSIREIAQGIGTAKVIFNQCVFFRVFEAYLLRSRFPQLKRFCFYLDRLMRRTPLRRFGYLKIIEFRKIVP